MNSTVQPGAPMASPAANEQRVRLVIEAEIFPDSEGGPDSLIATTDVLAAEPVSPARMLGMVAEARAKLDDIERLAKAFEAQDTLAAILAERHAQMEEWDTDTAHPSLRDTFVAAAMVTRGQMVIVVPRGQDPVVRTAAVVELVNDLDEQAARA